MLAVCSEDAEAVRVFAVAQDEFDERCDCGVIAVGIGCWFVHGDMG